MTTLQILNRNIVILYHIEPIGKTGTSCIDWSIDRFVLHRLNELVLRPSEYSQKKKCSHLPEFIGMINRFPHHAHHSNQMFHKSNFPLHHSYVQRSAKTTNNVTRENTKIKYYTNWHRVHHQNTTKCHGCGKRVLMTTDESHAWIHFLQRSTLQNLELFPSRTLLSGITNYMYLQRKQAAFSTFHHVQTTDWFINSPKLNYR